MHNECCLMVKINNPFHTPDQRLLGHNVNHPSRWEIMKTLFLQVAELKTKSFRHISAFVLKCDNNPKFLKEQFPSNPCIINSRHNCSTHP